MTVSGFQSRFQWKARALNFLPMSGVPLKSSMHFWTWTHSHTQTENNFLYGARPREEGVNIDEMKEGDVCKFTCSCISHVDFISPQPRPQRMSVRLNAVAAWCSCRVLFGLRVLWFYVKLRSFNFLIKTFIVKLEFFFLQKIKIALTGLMLSYMNIKKVFDLIFLTCRS